VFQSLLLSRSFVMAESAKPPAAFTPKMNPLRRS